MLYDGVQKLIRTHLEAKVAPVVARAPAEHMLELLCEQWTQHVNKMKMISDLLIHLVSGGVKALDPGWSFRSTCLNSPTPLAPRVPWPGCAKAERDNLGQLPRAGVACWYGQRGPAAPRVGAARDAISPFSLAICRVERVAVPPSRCRGRRRPRTGPPAAGAQAMPFPAPQHALRRLGSAWPGRCPTLPIR